MGSGALKLAAEPDPLGALWEPPESSPQGGRELGYVYTSSHQPTIEGCSWQGGECHSGLLHGCIGLWRGSLQAKGRRCWQSGAGPGDLWCQKRYRKHWPQAQL